MEEKIHRAAQMGYDGVECPGGMMEILAATALRQTAASAGVEISGIVFDKRNLSDQLPEVVQYMHEAGCDTVIFPGFFNLPATEEAFAAAARELNAWGAALRAENLRLLYHVHGHEFVSVNGISGMDILCRQIDMNLCPLEVDVYWVEWGGVDAVAFLRAHSSHTPMIHLKDTKSRNPFHDVEVGAGCINMKEILRIGLARPVEWLTVEQEEFDIPSLESAQKSCDNVKRMLTELEAKV
ncbi:sugar phosphate isomerase [Clostridia bacterium]|nr:sugar phosphate isomerase [Clostridia bacterium]